MHRNRLTLLTERCPARPVAIATCQVEITDEVEASVAVILGLVAVPEGMIAHDALVNVWWPVFA